MTDWTAKQYTQRERKYKKEGKEKQKKYKKENARKHRMKVLK